MAVTSFPITFPILVPIMSMIPMPRTHSLFTVQKKEKKEEKNMSSAIVFVGRTKNSGSEQCVVTTVHLGGHDDIKKAAIDMRS